MFGDTVFTSLVNTFFFQIICVLAGFGASTISFTSWCLILPYMLLILDYPLFPTLWLCVLADLTNSIFLIIIFGFQKKVVWSTWIFAVIQIPFSLGLSLYIGDYLIIFEGLLKSGSNILLFGLSFAYFLRFCILFGVDLYKKRKPKEKPLTFIQIDDEEDENDDSVSIIGSSTESYQSVFSVNIRNDDLNEKKVEPLFEKSYYKKKQKKKSVWIRLLKRFCAEKEDAIFKDEYKWYSALFRHSILIICMILGSSWSAFVKVSGGLFFNLVLQVLYKSKQLVSTATGIYISIFTLIPLLISFYPHTEIFDVELLYYSCICVVCNLAGCIFGLLILIMIPGFYIFLLIAITLLILGSGAAAIKLVSMF